MHNLATLGRRAVGFAPRANHLVVVCPEVRLASLLRPFGQLGASRGVGCRALLESWHPGIKVDCRERLKPKFLLSAETEYSAETQLFCKEQNRRIQNSTYPILQICHYLVFAEDLVRYSAEYFGRNRFGRTLVDCMS